MSTDCGAVAELEDSRDIAVVEDSRDKGDVCIDDEFMITLVKNTFKFPAQRGGGGGGGGGGWGAVHGLLVGPPCVSTLHLWIKVKY